MLDKDRNVIPHPAGVEQPVLLLNDAFDVMPRHVRVLFSEPVHDMAKCPHFFDDSHSESFGAATPKFKSGFFSSGRVGHLPIILRTPATFDGRP
nr:hypothetical protein [Arthrobacter nitrophenolicus]